MKSKISKREKVYYWYGYFQAYVCVANLLWGKPRDHITWEGINAARDKLREYELVLFKEISLLYSKEDIMDTIKNRYLKPEGEDDGTRIREGDKEKAPKGQDGFILYKLGSGLWGLKEEGGDK